MRHCTMYTLYNMYEGKKTELRQSFFERKKGSLSPTVEQIHKRRWKSSSVLFTRSFVKYLFPIDIMKG